MYALSVIFEIHPEHIEDFKAAAIAQADNSRTNEKECLGFAVFQEEGQPDRFYFHEVYASKSSLEDVHWKTPYFQDYTETTKPWIIKKDSRRWELAELQI